MYILGAPYEIGIAAMTFQKQKLSIFIMELHNRLSIGLVLQGMCMEALEIRLK